MQDEVRMFIDNEEVVSSNEFTINEEMLSASSTILNNCYPKSWELTKDYITNFYYPKDYSKLLIGKGKYEKGNTEFTILEEKSKNLFDAENWINQGANNQYYSYSNGKIIINKTDARTFNNFTESEKIYLPNGTYYLSGTGNAGIRIYNQGNDYTITQNQFNVTLGYIYLKFVSSSIIEIQPQIEKGTQATTYQPYNDSELQYETNVEKDLNKLIIQGNEYQETRTGRNLLQNIATTQTINDMQFKINDDGSITLNGTASALSYVLLSNILTLNGTYTLSGGSNLGMYVYMRGLNIDNGYSVDIQTHPNTYGTATLNGRYIFYVYVSSGTSLNNAKVYPQLELGSTPTPFEEYGKQPSPDFPSDIVNVGYQNIFNKSGIYIHSGGHKTEIDTGVRITQSIAGNYKYSAMEIGRDELLGKTLTISANVKPSASNIGGIFLFWGNSNSVSLQSITGMSVTGEAVITKIIPDTMYTGADRINILLYVNTTGTGVVDDYTDFEDLQIEISDTKHSYIPYNKYGIEITNTGKNLANINSVKIGKTWSNANNTSRATILYIPVKIGSRYTLVSEWTNSHITNIRAVFNHGIIDTINNAIPPSYPYLNESFEFASIEILADTTFTSDMLNGIRIMFCEGNATISDYVPYESNTQLFTLDEPLRAIGNDKDILTIENNKLVLTRKIGSIVLNGTEDFSGYAFGNYYRYSVGISTLNIAPKSDTILFSNYFYESSNALNSGSCLPGMVHYASAYSNIYFVSTQTTSANFKTWLTTHNTEIQYILDTPTIQELGEVEMPTSYEGVNYFTIYSGDITGATTIYYYWKNFDVLFSGIVKNSGEISLNPREPHYCNLQILDYKTFLSESDTLDFVISNKTIREAIQMVVDSVSGYGFQMGTINITQADEIIGAYSTLNQSPYDVLQYLANISGSRWRARYVDSSSMAIDFYDPDLLPQANSILYTKEYFEDNNIIDLTFNYGTRDYRNKQIVLSNEVYGDIDYTQNIYADGYTQEFLLEENIGNVKSLYLNGVIQDVITKEEKDNGVEGDFYYTPGKNTISSVKLLSVNNEIVITYTPLIKGRQIVYNSDEVNRISNQTATIGVISRYETRNDIFSNAELNQVGQTYINFKGTAEILLTLQTKDNDIFNIGEVAYFDAPINELKQYYMVKTKKINYVVINSIPTLFYEYQLTSSYNNEKAINYFDNQRNKAQGNIQLGQTITRNIDIENEAIIIWQNLEINEVELEINNNNTLNNIFNSPFTE